MRTDPVMLQVLRNHTRAAAESMATTLYRTAHSTFVKETEDFTIQILDANGKSCAVPIDLGATWYPGLDYERALCLVPGGYEPGDIAMTNDPENQQRSGNQRSETNPDTDFGTQPSRRKEG